MTQSFNQYSENETKIWRQSILNQFNRVSLSCLRSHFVISLLLPCSKYAQAKVIFFLIVHVIDQNGIHRGKKRKKQSELFHRVKKRKPWGPVQIGEGRVVSQRERLGLQSGQLGGRSNETREKG